MDSSLQVPEFVDKSGRCFPVGNQTEFSVQKLDRKDTAICIQTVVYLDSSASPTPIGCVMRQANGTRSLAEESASNRSALQFEL